MSKAAKRERQRQNREAAKQAQAQAEKRARLMGSLRFFGIAAVVVIAAAGIFQLVRGGGGSDSSASKGGVTCTDDKPPAVKKQTFPTAPAMSIDPAKTYTASMKTSCGTITMALDPKQAPQSVNSFVYLSKAGYYDGTLFHRIVKDFVDQGGDQTGTGTGGPGYTLPDEPPANGYSSGSVALANSGPNTSGSQFFIAVSDQGAQGLGTAPPFKYSILGQVTNGMNVAKKINSYGSSDSAGTPTRKIYVFSVSITEGAANTTDSSTTSSTAPATTPAP